MIKYWEQKTDFPLKGNAFPGGVDLGENNVGYLSPVVIVDVVPIPQVGGEILNLLRGDSLRVQRRSPWRRLCRSSISRWRRIPKLRLPLPVLAGARLTF